MKLQIIIFILLILNNALYSLSLMETDSSSELAGYYYPSFGLGIGYVIPESDFSKSLRYGIYFYQFTPTRLGLNSLKKTGFSTDNEIFISFAAAKRSSSLYYGGAEIYAGYHIDKNNFNITNRVSVLFKRSGNLDYGIQNKLTLTTIDSVILSNRVALTTGLNVNNNNRLTASFLSTSDFKFSWQTSLNNLRFKTGLRTENIFSPGINIGLFLSIGYTFDRFSLITSFDIGDHYEQRIIYEREYGPYTPPISFSPAFFPVKKQPDFEYGLASMKLMDNPPEPDIVLTVKRGDSLYQISRNLPGNADIIYHNNIVAIADYNQIKSPYAIFPGQKILVPSSQSEINRNQYSTCEIHLHQKIDHAIALGQNSDLIEVRVNSALWSYIIDGFYGMTDILPVRADIENKYLLNAQSIAELELRNPKSAIRKLNFSLNIDDNCPIINTNLSYAYFLDNQLEEALRYMLQAKSLVCKRGIDTSFHHFFIKKKLHLPME